MISKIVSLPSQEQEWLSLEGKFVSGISIPTGLSTKFNVCINTNYLSLNEADFSFKSPQFLRIKVNDKDVPLEVQASIKKPEIAIVGDLNFGDISMNAKVISKSLFFKNTGLKTGSFRIKYIGNTIKLSQLSGKIKPESSVEIIARLLIYFCWKKENNNFIIANL